MDKTKLILVMADGLGVPAEGWDVSVYAKYCNRRFFELLKYNSIPLDACLGVDGIPQSATGQTSLFTGINAAELIGRHLTAFPGKKLKEILSQRNILLDIKKQKKKSVFANAYIRHSLKEIYNSRFCSVTSAMNYSITEEALSKHDMLSGNAVYHDITRRTVADRYNIPKISPETAAEHLMNISEKNDLTLFEYFLTDRVGHKCDKILLKEILSDFGSFFSCLDKYKSDNTILVLCSDHGNCEDLTCRTHTQNPVPLIVSGLENYDKYNIKSIKDVYDFVFSILL